MTIQNIASFEAETAQTSATSKLVKAWEAKNAKRAVKASGATLMALSLSACGGSDDVAAPEAPEVPVVTPVSLALTTDQNIFTDLTAGDDTITGTQATMTGADVIVDDSATDNDTLTITSDGTAMTFGTVSGVENIVVNVSAFVSGAIDIEGVVDGTVTVSNTLFGGADGADINNAGSVTLVAGEGVSGTFDVAMVADAATIVDAGSATQATITAAAAGVNQAASVIANGDLAVVLANDFDSLAISSSEASVVTVTDGAGLLTTITADSNTTVDFGADIRDAEGLDITNAAGISGEAAGDVDLTGFSNITIEAEAVAVADTDDVTVDDGTSVTLNDAADILTFVAADADAVAASAPGEYTLNLTLGGDQAGAVGVAQDADGDDGFTTVNITTTEDVATLALAADADVTVNLFGASDVGAVTATVTNGAEVTLDATAMSGALTATASASLVSITGGAGDDTITAFAAATLDGGDGDDTLVSIAAMTGVTFSNFELLEFADGDAFDSSQLDGLSITTTGSTPAGADFIVVGAVDSNTLDMSGIQMDDQANGDGVDMTGAAQAATLVAGSAMDITGTNGDDVLIGFAGDDVVSGGAGIDTFTMGAGADTVTGGAGADIFVIVAGDSAEATFDTITDYAVVTAAGAVGDTLDIVAAGLTALLDAGADIAAGAVNVGAADASGVLAAADITAVVADGILTIDGDAADVAVIDTLAEFVDVATLALESYGGAAVAADEYAIAFEFGDDTYVVYADETAGGAVTVNDVIMLEGLTGATAVDLAAAATAGGIIIA